MVIAVIVGRSHPELRDANAVAHVAERLMLVRPGQVSMSHAAMGTVSGQAVPVMPGGDRIMAADRMPWKGMERRSVGLAARLSKEDNLFLGGGLVVTRSNSTESKREREARKKKKNQYTRHTGPVGELGWAAKVLDKKFVRSLA